MGKAVTIDRQRMIDIFTRHAEEHYDVRKKRGRTEDAISSMMFMSGVLFDSLDEIFGPQEGDEYDPD